MPPEESPQAKYERLKRQLQNSILSQYPNPDRKDCPGRPILDRLAARVSDENIEADVNWEHVTHCSECYREYLGFRQELKSAVRKRKGLTQFAKATAAIAAISLGLFVANRLRNGVGRERPHNAEAAYNKTTINIPTMTRSEDMRSTSPITFERVHEEVTVNLPTGSKAGPYEFRLLKNDQIVLSDHAEAKIHNGTTAFTLKINLSRIASGDYSMSVRQVPWDWNYFPVIVR